MRASRRSARYREEDAAERGHQKQSWSSYQFVYILLGPAVVVAAVLYYTLDGPYWWVPVAGLLSIVSWIWFRARR